MASCTDCKCSNGRCEDRNPKLGYESVYDGIGLRDQRILNGVDRLNIANGRRRKCTDPDNPKFGRYT